MRCNVDNIPYTAKPTDNGRITNDLKHAGAQVDISISELANVLAQGRTWTPAALSGSHAQDWQNQQFFAVDVDKPEKGEHLTPERALEISRVNGLEPCIIHSTFSDERDKPEQRRFRIIFAADGVITDAETAKGINIALCGLFGGDSACVDLARHFYGGAAGCIIHKQDITVDINRLKAMAIQPPAKTKERKFPNFDLLEHVKSTRNPVEVVRSGAGWMISPCPVCGHDDDFHLTGEVWHCFGADGNRGGGVLDYLQQVDGLTHAQAVKLARGTNNQSEARGGTQLYNLCKELGVEAFRDKDNGENYVIYTDEGRREIKQLRGADFRGWLTTNFSASYQTTPTRPAISGCLDLLSHEASKMERKTWIRWARVGDVFYLDLFDEKRQVVEVDKDGYRVVEDCPVLFRRIAGMKAMPMPALELYPWEGFLKLKEYLNLNEDDFLVLCGWLIGSCDPTVSKPILRITGEFESGKSTIMDIIQKIIDPISAKRKALPEKPDDLFCDAVGVYLMAYDNVKYVKIPDVICLISTGGTYSKRTLYENSETTNLRALRPMVWSGLVLDIKQPDLLSRFWSIVLQPIKNRKTEKEIRDQFGADLPFIVGGLLSALSYAVRNEAHKPVGLKTRMIDAASLVIRAELSDLCGWGVGRFGEVLARMDAEKIENAVCLDEVAAVITDIADKGGESLMMQGLLLRVREPRSYGDWSGLPKTARALGAYLVYIEPQLRQMGVTFSKKTITKGVEVTIFPRAKKGS